MTQILNLLLPKICFPTIFERLQMIGPYRLPAQIDAEIIDFFDNPFLF